MSSLRALPNVRRSEWREETDRVGDGGCSRWGVTADADEPVVVEEEQDMRRWCAKWDDVEVEDEAESRRWRHHWRHARFSSRSPSLTISDALEMTGNQQKSKAVSGIQDVPFQKSRTLVSSSPAPRISSPRAKAGGASARRGIFGRPPRSAVALEGPSYVVEM
jgi:hypothetical protein